GSGKSSCQQRQSGRSESRWEKTMLGKSFTHGPSSEKESCSEQICLLPARETWQCALIHASTRFSFDFRLTPITSARQAWFSVIRAINCVFFSGESRFSL